jgi:hypothetical protein
VFPGPVIIFAVDDWENLESVKVFDVPEPDHKATVCPVPAPSNTEELSIFSHASVPPCSINTAQSPVTQSVTPSKFVLPDVDTM